MEFKVSEADRLNYRIKNLEFQIEQLHLTSDETFTIKVNEGKIKGAQRRTIYDDTYYSFERIPYAQPPVGELRFRAPKPLSSWRGVRDCTHYGAKPVQRDFISGETEGAEDCLYLNVYTNNLKPNKARPVMVWIYGGGFKFGEATREWYAPDYFMMKDVVLVTVQYRLGALGFLSLTDPGLHTPGNAALKDQIMALKWIKRNCAHFGGNPECVTLFGESAGAASVHALMLAEPARGLFQRAILQSGVITSDWADNGSTEHALLLAQAAGYTGEPEERLVLNCLMSCTAEEILSAEKLCQSNLMKPVLFGITVEPYFTQHTVLNKPFLELLDGAWGNSIPLMIGATSNEGLAFLQMFKNFPEYFQMQLKTCESYVPKAAVLNRDSPECQEKGLKLRRLHVSGETATNNELFELFSFVFFWNPIQTALLTRLQQKKKAATFLYRFDFDSDKLLQPFRLMRQGLDGSGGNGESGVGHADELPFLFHNVLARRMERQSREYRTIERMIGLWTTFAENGNPNGGKINGMKDIKWQPLHQSTADWKCLNIGDELKFIDLPEKAKLRGWRELYDMHREPPKAYEAVDLSVYAKSSL